MGDTTGGFPACSRTSHSRLQKSLARTAGPRRVAGRYALIAYRWWNPPRRRTTIRSASICGTRRHSALRIFIVLSALAHGALLVSWPATTPVHAVGSAPLAIRFASIPQPGSATDASPPSHQPRPDHPAKRERPVATLTPPRSTNDENTDRQTDTTSARPPAAAAASPAPSATLHAQVQALLTAQLARFFDYPHVARLRGWQGQVVLQVHVAGDGRLEDIRVGTTSGFAVLDLSATHSLARVGNIGQAPWLPRHGIDIQLPVVYRLSPRS